MQKNIEVGRKILSELKESCGTGTMRQRVSTMYRRFCEELGVDQLETDDEDGSDMEDDDRKTKLRHVLKSAKTNRVSRQGTREIIKAIADPNITANGVETLWNRCRIEITEDLKLISCHATFTAKGAF
uniref:Uncharacterized protein n=1 Tax=Spongospora subterranea TaxID=70186 RepID=A0A0H5QZ30_9EUKA|eukprot:CRZ07195.1 hypothetical protein [Spongospora subterranea]